MAYQVGPNGTDFEYVKTKKQRAVAAASPMYRMKPYEKFNWRDNAGVSSDDGDGSFEPYPTQKMRPYYDYRQSSAAAAGPGTKNAPIILDEAFQSHDFDAPTEFSEPIKTPDGGMVCTVTIYI